MTDQRIRLAFGGGEHRHFEALLKSALASPTAEVVGYSIEDDELREHFVGKYSGVPAFRTSEELYDRAKPEAIVTCAEPRLRRAACRCCSGRFRMRRVCRSVAWIHAWRTQIWA